LTAYKARKPGRHFYQLIEENFIATPTVVGRRGVFALAGLFDPDLRGPEDIDLWLRIAKLGDLGFLDEVLVFKRDHDACVTRQPWYQLTQIRAREMWMHKWKDDPEAVQLIKARLGELWADMAYHERRRRNYRGARIAYWRAARLGCNVRHSVALAGLLSPHALCCTFI